MYNGDLRWQGPKTLDLKKNADTSAYASFVPHGRKHSRRQHTGGDGILGTRKELQKKKKIQDGHVG